VPNLLALWYGYHHNKTLIVDKLDASAQHSFQQLTLWFYVVAFSIGAAFTITLSERLKRSRTNALQLGHRIAMLCFMLWVVTGIVVPLTLQISGSHIPASTYVHFIATQLVCGAIALAYPYFLVNFYAVRCLYPIFLPHGRISDDDARQLRALDRRATLYLGLAASIPLIGVAGATFIPPTDIAKVIIPIRVLCVGSVVAFLGAYWLFRLLEKDISALERVVSGRRSPVA
jgi:protein-S-isoprenylcysteine O-methyltransferase Ste14